MPPNIEKGEVALYKYNKLRYSFVGLEAGEQHILASDPWAFLSSHLQVKLSKSRGNNKEKIERALYFAGLAEDFYNAAESIPLPAKGTLLYYGMLDLAKCYLSLNDVQLETTHEHHGLNLPLGKVNTVEVKGRMKDAINIFSSFSENLGSPIIHPIEVNFQQALSHVPEIHGIYTSLGHIKKRKLLPINIEFQVNGARDKIFTEIVFQKEQESKVETNRFLKGERTKYFKEGYPRQGMVVYRAKRRKSYTKDNLGRIYKNILAEYKKHDIVTILTTQGYRYYVDLRPGKFPSICYTLLAMFYLGSAARYRPLEIKSLLDGELRPLVSEFVSLSPRQYLYQMVSLVTSKECVIPFSAI
ncbi:YaaC family protein [Sedimenticola hydrogenitrophicus]|uniref:YaaC family protein n=1 Tax=Sedimenticola hydrogenitrophicus TaxID=2967975 RepID=UPI0023AF0CAC